MRSRARAAATFIRRGRSSWSFSRPRLGWLGITFLAALFAVAVQTASAKPPALAGTVLIAGQGGETGDIGTSEVTGTCDPSGTSTFAFSVTGSSFDPPYPGTFTESGTFTLGPAVTAPDGNIVLRPIAFESTFTILSGTTTITGEKTLAPGQAKARFGGCGELLAQPGFPTPNAAAIEVDARYAAEIQLETGEIVRDQGESEVIYSDLGVRDVPFAAYQFLEFFLSRRG